LFRAELLLSIRAANGLVATCLAYSVEEWIECTLSQVIHRIQAKFGYCEDIFTYDSNKNPLISLGLLALKYKNIVYGISMVYETIGNVHGHRIDEEMKRYYL
jgi:hypothetical protein